jgi:hypothetical protein
MWEVFTDMAHLGFGWLDSASSAHWPIDPLAGRGIAAMGGRGMPASG